MEEILDLSKQTWVVSVELQADIIMTALTENFPKAIMEDEIQEVDLMLEDLIDDYKLKILLEHLYSKFPE